jgi:hypothetical protein
MLESIKEVNSQKEDRGGWTDFNCYEDSQILHGEQLQNSMNAACCVTLALFEEVARNWVCRNDRC